jgi:hypothetical protein
MLSFLKYSILSLSLMSASEYSLFLSPSLPHSSPFLQPDSPFFYHRSFSLSTSHVRLSSSAYMSLPDIPLLFRLPIKRKASEEPDGPQDSLSSSSKDFEAGRVTCEACGDSVSYRDERSGAFTTKHWDAHKQGW